VRSAGALAAVTPGAFAPGSIVVLPPWIDVLPGTSGTLEGTSFPPSRLQGRLALFGVEEWVQRREHRHGCASPGVVKPVLQEVGDSRMFMPFLRFYKLR
jgi:hypothetical protein